MAVVFARSTSPYPKNKYLGKVDNGETV